MPKRIDMAEFEKLVHSMLNGHGNIYSIPVRALGVGLRTEAEAGAADERLRSGLRLAP